MGDHGMDRTFCGLVADSADAASRVAVMNAAVAARVLSSADGHRCEYVFNVIDG